MSGDPAPANSEDPLFDQIGLALNWQMRLWLASASLTSQLQAGGNNDE
jgi:hypothetical protein